MVGGGMGRLWAYFTLLTLVSAGPLQRYTRESEDYQNDFSAYTNYTANEVCFSEGEVFQKGDMMPNPGPCEECRCEPPSIVCNMIKCPVNNNGCRTIQRANHCCPDYNCECDYNGQLYNDGERLELPEEPCQVCYCKGGEVMCNSITCYHRDDCDPIQVPGQCCPKYENCPVRDMGSSSSDDKNILVRSTNKTNHVSPKREMNPWLLTKVPPASSASPPKNMHDPTTERGNVIIVSDWLSERRTTTEDVTSNDDSGYNHNSVSTDKPSLSTNLDHLTTDVRQDINSDGANIVKNSDTITPVDEVIFTRIDYPNKNNNSSLEDAKSILPKDAQLNLTSGSDEKLTSGMNISETPINSTVYNNEKYIFTYNPPNTESTSEIYPLETVGVKSPIETPIKILELTTNEVMISTEASIDSSTIIDRSETKGETETTELNNDSPWSSSNYSEENGKMAGNKFKPEEINTNINQGMDTTDLQGPFFVEGLELSTTHENDYTESTTQKVETKEELRENQVSSSHNEIKSPSGSLDTTTSKQKYIEDTTSFSTEVKIEKNHLDKRDNATDTPTIKTHNSENPIKLEMRTKGDEVSSSTVKYISSNEQEESTDTVDNEFSTVDTKMRRNNLNGSTSMIGKYSPINSTTFLTVDTTQQSTNDTNAAEHQQESVRNYTSDSMKIYSTNVPEITSYPTVSGSDDPGNEKEHTSDEPPVLELNSHVPFLQLGGHENTVPALNTLEENYETTTTTVNDKEGIIRSSFSNVNSSNYEIHDSLVKQADSTETTPSPESSTDDMNQTTILENKKLVEDTHEDTTDAILTSSHMPLTPGDLKVIAEYLINDTIKPVEEKNNSEYTTNEWLKGNLTSAKTISSIMSAANISIAIMNKTGDEANRIIEKVNKKVSKSKNLDKYEKDIPSSGNNALNNLKTDNKTGFIQGKNYEYLNSPQISSDPEIPSNDEAKEDIMASRTNAEPRDRKNLITENSTSSNVKINKKHKFESSKAFSKLGESSTPPSTTAPSDSHILPDTNLQFDKVNPAQSPVILDVESNASRKDKSLEISGTTTKSQKQPST